MKRFTFFRKKSVERSLMVRCEQMAEVLNARVNPEKDYADDVCVYVKVRPPNEFPHNSYLDLIDHPAFYRYLTRHKKMQVIAVSKNAYTYLSDRYLGRKIVHIPQHHCNFDNELKGSETVEVVGVIGNRYACEFNLKEMEKNFRNIGIKVVFCFKPRTRMEVVDFYKSIDVQLVYRPNRMRSKMAGVSTSLKVANACAFGVPTVAYPEPAFDEDFPGCYLKAISRLDVFHQVWRLKQNRMLYRELSQRGIEKASPYHISKIAQMYKELL